MNKDFKRHLMPNRRAVAALINFNGKILVGKKKKDAEGFLAGKWHIPGETLEDGENNESALIRGIKEEAGIEIQVVRYLGTHRTPRHTEVKWYECIPKTYNIVAGSDLEEIKWVSKKDVLNLCRVEAISLWPKEIKEYFT